MTDRIKETIRDAIVKGAFEAARSPDTATQGSDVNVITSKVLTEVAPIVAHATNNEPFYQSRVTIGAVIGLVGGLYTLGLDFADGTPPTVEAFTAQATVIGGAILTLYGRWIAKKPLGS